jgi:ceramide glucosyltransferase
VSGLAEIRGQKIHNQLAGIEAAGDQATVLAFVDSDACLPRYWLGALVHPLRRKDIGASTGYRWFVPTDNRISTQVLSAMNGFIASLLGPHKWNSAWGGGMAIKRENFRRWGIQEIWRRSCLDDYTLTRQVKKAGLPIAFVPACFVASYEETTWKQLWDFGRRQFILTWAYYRQLWWLGVAGLGQFIVGFWGGTAVSLYLWRQGSEHAPYAAILPLFLYFCSMIKAAARQIMIGKILHHDRQKLLIPAIIDLLIQPITAILMLTLLLSTACSKSIFWRGHRYDLTNPDRVEIT